jgi:hypothetical protein
MSLSSCFEFLLTLTEDVGVGLHECKRKRKQGRRDGFCANGLIWRVGGFGRMVPRTPKPLD